MLEIGINKKNHPDWDSPDPDDTREIKMSDPHYPDDIRKYDNDPRSPFYDDSAEDAKDEWIDQRAEELAEDSALVTEAIAEMPDEELSWIGIRSDMTVYVADANELYIRIGEKVAKQVNSYLEKLAQNEWDAENDE